LRYFNAAGYDPDGEVRGLEKEPNNLLPLVLETLLGWRENLEVYGTDYDTEDGSCIRDYIHVSDLADAHLRALNFLEEHDEDLVLNLGTSKGISVLEILDAAKKVGFKTAFVRRPNEWGAAGPPDPTPNPNHDIIVDTFPQLAEKLGV